LIVHSKYAIVFVQFFYYVSYTFFLIIKHVAGP
jgi:hypothetical protein